jgi:flagellar biosynthesis/type III secretory pathway protein FliH
MIEDAALEHQYETGKAEGKAEGEAEGEANKTRKVALEMLKENFSDEMILKITQITLDELSELKKSLNS